MELWNVFHENDMFLTKIRKFKNNNFRIPNTALLNLERKNQVEFSLRE